VQHGQRLHVRGVLRPPEGARRHRGEERVARQCNDDGQPDRPVRHLAAGARARAASPLPHFRRRPRGQAMSREPDADVLVIGSGAAGAAICSRLAGRGARVRCLEQGEWVDRARLPKSHPDWEVRGRRREPLPTPPAPIGRPGQLLVNAYEKLGWYWWPTEQAITTRAYRGRPACDNRGWCTFGCPQGSLSTADLTYWPGALKNGVDLRTQARCTATGIGQDGRALGARYYDQDGVVRDARAAVTVGACGGLGTPRLLLMSTSPSHPDGLANSSGLVGKNLMVPVHSFASGLL